MGTQLGALVSGKEIKLDALAGKRIAVDAFNWLYQFLSIIRGSDGEPLKDSKGRITSHLSGLFYRSVNLLEAGVKPVFVFDGEPPELKVAESAKRREYKEQAAKAFSEAKERGDVEAMQKYAARTARLDEEMLEDSKVLLDAMGIPWVQAPSEGEALCSQMVIAGDVWAVATQDYDALLFGAPRVVRNLSISGKRKYGRSDFVLVQPELVELNKVLKELDLTLEQLRIVGVLIGTDYDPGGVRGIGPKKALKLVKEKKPAEIWTVVEWNFPFTPDEIIDFFRSPPKGEYKIKFGGPDDRKIMHVLCEEHDFSEERVQNALARILEKRKGSLSSFV